jgi:indoleamine 2,3-dioxygenase
MKDKYSDNFFSIDKIHGFLPIKDPLPTLPEKYSTLQMIIYRLPVIISDPNSINDSLTFLIFEKLPNYIDTIKTESDIFILQALFRAYSFLSLAYLLEPVHITHIQTGKYGKARNIIPFKIAIPYVYLANKLEVYPWFDYYYTYALCNYVKIYKNNDLHWKNLNMACRFTNTDDESGFAMIQVYINKVSNKLIESIYNSFEAINNDNIEQLIESIKLCYDTITEINFRKKQIWITTNYMKYNDFRVFIMGSQYNSDIFENGVIYEGVDDEKQTYYGHIENQDNITLTLDIFTGINKYYSENKVNTNLCKFKPKCVREFLKDLEHETIDLDWIYLLKKCSTQTPLVYFLGIIKEIYSFRFGHWNYVKKYVMENTSFSSGITDVYKWIPKQMEACCQYYNNIKSSIDQDNLSSHEKKLFEDIENSMLYMIENNN